MVFSDVLYSSRSVLSHILLALKQCKELTGVPAVQTSPSLNKRVTKHNGQNKTVGI